MPISYILINYTILFKYNIRFCYFNKSTKCIKYAFVCEFYLQKDIINYFNMINIA